MRYQRDKEKIMDGLNANGRCMKPVEVKGLGDLYKLGPVLSKHRAQYIFRRSPQNQTDL